MEEVYTCECGCQVWVIYSNKHIKCANCLLEYHLPITGNKQIKALTFNQNYRINKEV